MLSRGEFDRMNLQISIMYQHHLFDIQKSFTKNVTLQITSHLLITFRHNFATSRDLAIIRLSRVQRCANLMTNNEDVICLHLAPITSLRRAKNMGMGINLLVVFHVGDSFMVLLMTMPLIANFCRTVGQYRVTLISYHSF